MSIHDFTVTSLAGTATPLASFRGNVVLIVNTASQCGLTPQYAGLQALYDRHRADGLQVLGLPCNQFGNQEPGDADAIGSFCSKTYGVSFPMFAKIEVNGPGTHPLFAYLKRERPGLLGSQAIKWNFTKFLVDRTGKPKARYGPTATPASLAGDIEALLRAC